MTRECDSLCGGRVLWHILLVVWCICFGGAIEQRLERNRQHEANVWAQQHDPVVAPCVDYSSGPARFGGTMR